MESKFHVLTTFTIHYTLCLIFIRVWPIKDLLFEIRQIDKVHKLYDKFKYIYRYIYIIIIIIYIYIYTHTYIYISTPHKMLKSRRSKMYITYVIIGWLSPKMVLWQLKHWPHDVYDVQWASSLYITLLAKLLYVYMQGLF